VEEYRILEGLISTVGLLHQAGFKVQDRENLTHIIISRPAKPQASCRADWGTGCDPLGEELTAVKSGHKRTLSKESPFTVRCGNEW